VYTPGRAGAASPATDWTLDLLAANGRLEINN
jgi:hypothetical protein